MIAPEIDEGLAVYWMAFWDLSSCRTDAGMIPWTAVQLWANTYDLDEEVTEELHFLIREMDNVFIKFSRTKAKLSRDNKPDHKHITRRENGPVSREHPIKR